MVCVAIVPRPVRADTVTFLPDDAAAVEAWCDMVLAARTEIDVAYFIIDDDTVGCCFLQLLADAARRGVRVRVVVDGLGNRMDDDAEAMLLASGVRIKKYHPPQIPFVCDLTRRLHDKLLLCDGTEMIVGSRNIDDAHFGLNEDDSDNYLDLDVRVRGASAAQAGCYFDCLWESDELREVHRDCRATCCTTCCTTSAAQGGCAVAHGGCPEVRELPPPPTDTACPCQCQCQWPAVEVDAGNLCFLRDACSRKDCPSGVRESLYRILESAQCSIVLETPYFIPSDDLGRILQDALSRGVEVYILTNSWHATDYPMIYAAYCEVIGRYQRLGARVWEYPGPRTLHAKSFVVDGRIAGVTSFNFDPRSAYLDTQTGLVARDPEAAARLLAILDGHFALATPVGPGGLCLGPKAEATAAPGNPPNPVRLSILRLLAPMVWRHL